MIALKNNGPATHLCIMPMRTARPPGRARRYRQTSRCAPSYTTALIGATPTTVPARACNLQRDPRDGPRVENESIELRCVRFFDSSMRKDSTMPAIKEAPAPKTENAPGQTRELASRTPAAPPATTSGQFGFLRRFAREMDQLFDDFGLGSAWHMPTLLTRGRELLRRETGIVPAEWSPRVDILERDGQLVVRADLPGLSKDDIKVDVTDDTLTIQGERTHEEKGQREGCCYSECSYGSFYRAIPLPEGAETSKATAEFDKGVLKVTVPTPKRPETKAKRLEVREAK